MSHSAYYLLPTVHCLLLTVNCLLSTDNGLDGSGVNHPWLTNDFGTGLGPGIEDTRLNTRFNINIGYYF